MSLTIQKKSLLNVLFKRVLNTLLLIVLFPFIIIFLCVLPLLLILRFLHGLFLGYLVMLRWHPKHKNILFVYSDSPNWKEYIESNILPKIKDQTIVLNWSDRSKPIWREKPLEVKLFIHWSQAHPYKNWRKWDGREYNPIAIVFDPWWNVKVLRFWNAFRYCSRKWVL